MSSLGAFIANPLYKIPKKKQNKYYYNGGKLGRTPKSDKEVKKSKATGQVNSGTGVKIRRLRKFHSPASFLLLCFLLLFSSGF